jgi:hypothetical protein
MAWHNNPESVRAIHAARRDGYSTDRARLIGLVKTQRDLPVVSH